VNVDGNDMQPIDIDAKGLRQRVTRFIRVAADENNESGLLNGCQVVAADGTRIGSIQALIVDARTRRLRYVAVRCHNGHHVAEVDIPWETLYFDSAMARLVYYTCA